MAVRSVGSEGKGAVDNPAADERRVRSGSVAAGGARDGEGAAAGTDGSTGSAASVPRTAQTAQDSGTRCPEAQESTHHTGPRWPRSMASALPPNTRQPRRVRRMRVGAFMVLKDKRAGRGWQSGADRGPLRRQTEIGRSGYPLSGKWFPPHVFPTRQRAAMLARSHRSGWRWLKQRTTTSRFVAPEDCAGANPVRGPGDGHLPGVRFRSGRH